MFGRSHGDGGLYIETVCHKGEAMSKWLVMISFVACMSISFGGELKVGGDPSKNLAQVKGDFVYSEMPLKQVIEDFRTRAAVNIMCEPDVDMNATITFSARNTTAQKAFDEMIKSAKLTYKVHSDESYIGVYSNKSDDSQGQGRKTINDKPSVSSTANAKVTQSALSKEFTGEYSEMELRAICADFFKQAGIQYEVSPSVEKLPIMGEKFTFSFRKMPFEKAFTWILRRAYLSYSINEKGIVVIQEKDVAPVSNSNLFPIARTGTAAQVRKELEAGANINAKDKYGSTALFAAAESNERLDVLQALIGAGINPKEKNTAGDTALHFAAQSNTSPEIVRALIKAGNDVNQTDDELKTPLFLAAVCNKNPKVLELLIKLGADITAKTKTGLTPLMGAKRHKNEAAIKVLMKAGAKE